MDSEPPRLVGEIIAVARASDKGSREKPGVIRGGALRFVVRASRLHCNCGRVQAGRPHHKKASRYFVFFGTTFLIW